jgi:hypothetical protein
VKFTTIVARAGVTAFLFVGALPARAAAGSDSLALYDLSVTGGQPRFFIGGCMPADGVEVRMSSNLNSTAWQAVEAIAASTNPILFSTAIPTQRAPVFLRVVVDRGLGLPLTARGHDLYNAFGNKMYLRGMGRANGNDSPVGDWWGPGGAYWDGSQWDYNFAHLTQKMDATLQAMRLTYKCNMIREFLPVNWWWEDNIDTSKYLYFPKATTSYRDYKELLAQRALLQGMYVDFCPYSFRSYQDGDGGGGAPAVAAMDSNGIAVMNAIDSSDPTYVNAWRMWWTSVVLKLGKYPNVIFELWNEPDGNSTVKSQYFNHCVEMYKTIRSLGNTNLIMMQWRMTAVPGWQEELTWIPDLYHQIERAIGGTPTNLVFTFHAYRYVWNRQWGTNYNTVLSQLQAPNWIPQTRSTNVDVPVICNESGPGMNLSGGALAAEMGWWDGINRACLTEDVGFCAYYWLPIVGWRPEEALIGAWPTGVVAPTPSQSGQTWINNAP